MYALKVPEVGLAVVSRMGHDKGRLYIVAAVLNSDFILCTDGDVRPLDKPKTKRVKHVKAICLSEPAQTAIKSGKPTDAKIKKILRDLKDKKQ